MPETALTAPVGIAAEAQALATTDWATMDDGERGAVIPKLFDTYRRRDALAQWNVGRALQAHRQARSKGDWKIYLDSIGMERTMAFRLRKIARLDALQIATCQTAQDAIDTVDALEKPQPAPVVEPTDSDPAPVEPEVLDPEDWTEEERRIEEEERLSIRTEHLEPDPEPDPERGWKLYREELKVSNDKTTEINRLKRKNRDIEAFCLSVKDANPAVDECLARFFNAARRAA